MVPGRNATFMSRYGCRWRVPRIINIAAILAKILATQLTKPVGATRGSPLHRGSPHTAGHARNYIVHNPKNWPGTNIIFTPINTDRICPTIISQPTQSEHGPIFSARAGVREIPVFPCGEPGTTVLECTCCCHPFWSKKCNRAESKWIPGIKLW